MSKSPTLSPCIVLTLRLFVLFLYILLIIAVIILGMVYKILKKNFIMEIYVGMNYNENLILLIHILMGIIFLFGFIIALPCFKKKDYKPSPTKGEYSIYIRLLLVGISQTMTGIKLTSTTKGKNWPIIYAIIICIDLVLSMILLLFNHPYIKKIILFFQSILFDIFYGIIFPVICIVSLLKLYDNYGNSIILYDIDFTNVVLGARFVLMTDLVDLIFVKMSPFLSLFFTLYSLIGYLNCSNYTNEKKHSIIVTPKDNILPTNEPSINNDLNIPANNVKVSRTLRIFSIILALYGIIILIVGIITNKLTSCPSNCDYPLRIWFNNKCECAIQTIKCQSTGNTTGLLTCPDPSSFSLRPNNGMMTINDNKINDYLLSQSKYLHYLTLVHCRSESISSNTLKRFNRLNTLKFTKVSGTILRKWNLTELSKSLIHISIENADLYGNLTNLYNLPSNIKLFTCISCGLFGHTMANEIPNNGWENLKSISLSNNLLGISIGATGLSYTFPNFLNTSKINDLKWLALDANGLSYIPEDFGTYKSVQKLTLLTIPYGSYSKLPENIGNLENLETLVVHASPYLASLPMSISKLKKLSIASFFVTRLCLDTRKNQEWYKNLTPFIMQELEKACAYNPVSTGPPTNCTNTAFYSVRQNACSSACYYDVRICDKTVCGICDFLNDKNMAPVLPIPTSCS